MMDWREQIKNKINEINSNSVEIVSDFPSRDNFAKSNYRKSWVSVIFVDIINYTKLCEDKSDLEVGKILRVFHEGILEIFSKFNIKHIDIQGDGIFGLVSTEPGHSENSIKIFESAKEISGYLNHFMSECKYKISIAMGEELMLIVGEGDEKKIVFAGGIVNIAKKIMDSNFENSIAIHDVFYKKNEKLFENEHNLRNPFVKYPYYISKSCANEWMPSIINLGK